MFVNLYKSKKLNSSFIQPTYWTLVLYMAVIKFQRVLKNIRVFIKSLETSRKFITNPSPKFYNSFEIFPSLSFAPKVYMSAYSKEWKPNDVSLPSLGFAYSWTSCLKWKICTESNIGRLFAGWTKHLFRIVFALELTIEVNIDKISKFFIQVIFAYESNMYLKFIHWNIGTRNL